MELHWADATELAARVRGRELSPVELLAALRERAAQLNGELNAIVAEDPGAEAAARAAEAAAASGAALGPLHGVPFTVKDTLDVAGVPSTRGSLLFAGRLPGEDAEAVARMRGAGAICLGKTNTPEFALWWETGNLVYGRTLNPWDRERTPGGSSGGEAAAIAAGLSPLGLGSDLGGSIRNPASLCGVVGFKPTHGRVPLTGHFPDTISRFMHVGPLARSVRDAALAISLLAGPDGRDWYAVPVPAPAPPRAGRLDGLRILRVADGCFGPVQAEVSAAVDAAAEALREAGAEVRESAVPGIARIDANPLTLKLYGAEGSAYLRAQVGDREDELHPFLRSRLGLPLPELADYTAAEADVEQLRRDVVATLRECDLLLCPTVPVTAPRHDFPHMEVDGQELHPRSVMRITLLFDLTGMPALSVPFAMSRAGLPIGVQLAGRRFEDSEVLRAGLALEAARGPLPHPTS